MALIDEIIIQGAAGKGGNGVVRWRREKFRPKSGPGGGNGGRGGSLRVRAIRDIMVLANLQPGAQYTAEKGEDGRSNSQEGKGGNDLTLELPIGSVITIPAYNRVIELLNEGEEHVLLEGGQGGLGNEHFKSSTNQAPKQFTEGKGGEVSPLHIELKLIADIGLIGLPNAGKTSLLNELTNATGKVGAYPFTTISPNLGVMHGYTIADIPGLIEGASEGKGLGDKFLRHIQRTKLLVHCISSERDTVSDDYTLIRKEISAIEGLSEKPEVIILTKTDLRAKDEVKALQLELQKFNAPILSCSVLDTNSIKQLMKELISILQKSSV